jgi:hypothetical protein
VNGEKRPNSNYGGMRKLYKPAMSWMFVVSLGAHCSAGLKPRVGDDVVPATKCRPWVASHYLSGTMNLPKKRYAGLRRKSLQGGEYQAGDYVRIGERR